MSDAMSKYILEDDEIECVYPDIGHCPIRCMSRSYAHLFMRFQNLEESIREMRRTLDTVLDYVIRGVKSSSSSDSDKARDKKKTKKKGKKSRGGSRSGSDVIDQDLLDVQATLERDFSQLLTWKNSDDEGGKPKKPRRCEVIHAYLKTGISSDEGDSCEQESSGDEHIHATAEIIVTADVAELQAQSNDENGGQSAEEEENDEPDYTLDFLALYNENNEMNEVD
ncbi:uncharacterized protein LOC121739215 [Aricia agestis]|uniref:uncharacterized protein LOC121739215 n=1 Tax=Aricia agestis TaxID=91739 RepID=UPI001C20C2AB|nr:uncharacterized protein LOC121739215 [Aricia agestis]